MNHSRHAYNDIHRRLQLCPPQVLNPSAAGRTQQHFRQNLTDLEKLEFLKSIFMNTYDIKYDPWLCLMLQQFPIHVLVHAQEHCLVYDFLWISCVPWRRVRRTPPPFCKRECPKLRKVISWNKMVRSTLLQGTSFKSQGIIQQVGPDHWKVRSQKSNRI